MAPLPSPGNVLRVEFKIGDGASIEAGSRFFLSYTGGTPNTTDLNTLATDVATDWNTHMASVTASTDSLHGVTITDLSSDTGAVGEWTGTHSGTGAADTLQASICAVVNHQVGRRYRGGRPRTYLRCGGTGDLSTPSQWLTDSAATFLSSWEAWIAAILATTGLSITLANIVNVSWYEGYTNYISPSGRYRSIPKLRVGGPIVDDIVGSSIPTKLGSQRRRLNV